MVKAVSNFKDNNVCPSGNYAKYNFSNSITPCDKDDFQKQNKPTFGKLTTGSPTLDRMILFVACLGAALCIL